ncbi:MAG: DUF1269 domain-containing protein [Deltaproteobacteria bacterium]|nr:DUF1269 domain-containing protein [Deltaproteobacteria bacterium]
MADLIVLAFDNETGAAEMRDELIRLQKQELIELQDAAIVVRKADGKPKIKQVTSLAGAGALGGAFWGLLIGLLFFAPWLGLAIGAVTGAVAGKLTDVGIDDNFIKEVGDTIEPGHSALFLLISKITPDKVLEHVQPYNPTVLQTNLSADDEAKLRAAFHHEDDEDEGAPEAA